MGEWNDVKTEVRQLQVCQTSKGWERASQCDKVADLCGVKSPLQRHQPLSKQMPHQHSIDLRNNKFLCFLTPSFPLRCVYGASPDRKGPRDWTGDGAQKGGLGEAPKHSVIYIPFLWEKQWLKAKDGNPPPIRKKNNHQKAEGTKGRKLREEEGDKVEGC